MSTNLDHRNRRVPVMCFLLLLFSTIITTSITPIYSIFTLISRFKEYPDFYSNLFEGITATMAHNVISFSAVFLFALLIMLICKAKGWAIAILSFIASFFMLVIGIIVVIPHVVTIYQLIADFSIITIYFLYYLTPLFLSMFVEGFLPIFTAGCWFALGLAGLFSIGVSKAKKKGAKGFFGTFTVLFGISASGMFTLSTIGNVIILIYELYNNHYQDLLSYIGYNMLLAFIPFAIANALGFVGIILLSVYFIKPYKKGYVPEAEKEDLEVIGGNDELGEYIESMAEVEIGETAADDEAERAAAYRAARAEEAKRAAEYRERLQKAKARQAAQNTATLRENAANKAKSRWTPIYTFSFITLLVSLIVEPAAFIPFIGVIAIIVLLCAKKKAPIIVMAILNMLFGAGIICIIAGILMLLIPEDTLLD